MIQIKQEAVFEIEIRYKRSFNAYIFPKYESDSNDQPILPEENGLECR
jgi:hypothetical protein